ncbi:secretin N-terminal domain-containing protein [Chromatiaceae bacterium AAb-1]|nr:secretin N-terminal domain-containing protein [Chromatiaceae bacterium AAb-1]
MKLFPCYILRIGAVIARAGRWFMLCCALSIAGLSIAGFTTGMANAVAAEQEELISLNFQDIPVRSVLQILADFNQFNLVVSDTVTGNITLRLENIRWQQALDTILTLKELDKRQQGNILLIAPAAELASRDKQQLQLQQQVTESEPLSSVLIPVNYARAADIAALLNNQQTTLLSVRGSAVVDERTNTLLLHDTVAVIRRVKTLLEQLDIPVRQVVIESRMVMLRDNVMNELGIRWGRSTASTENWNVNLPVHAPAGSIALHVARLADDTLLDLELSALALENKGEIIASPRIMTANQKRATIEQGVEIPYVQAAASGATAVEFKKAVLSLTVTPHITPDHNIILDLVITQNTRGETVQTATGPATAIDTQQIQTQVLAAHGETIVLGGIYQQQILSTVTKVPLLGDIPYLGQFFRNTRQVTEKNELLIFVTPRIQPEAG